MAAPLTNSSPVQEPGPSQTKRIADASQCYYDAIADRYDQTVDHDPFNEKIRSKVASAFLSHIPPRSTVLDFGGGTGKDLAWLLDQKYCIVFCEPSANMRAKAIAYCRSRGSADRVRFLEGDATDFNNWQKKEIFPGTVQGVLSNFAAVNCISNLRLLFKNLRTVTSTDAHILMLILNSNLSQRWKYNRRATVWSLLTGQTVEYFTSFEGHKQRVYLHSRASLRAASRPYFSNMSVEKVAGSNFSIYHFHP